MASDDEGKLKGLKDAADAAAIKVKDMLPGVTTSESDDESARHKLTQMQRRSSGEDEEAQRGMAAKENIMSGMGNLTDAIKSKMTMPTDVVNQTRAARESGGAHRKDPTGDGERLVSVEKPAEDTKMGPTWSMSST